MKAKKQYLAVLVTGLGLVIGLSQPGAAQQSDPHAGHTPGTATGQTTAPKTLPPVPASLPGWINSQGGNEIFYKRGAYNFDIYNVPKLAYDLNAVAVGHSMAYEDLVTENADRLETETFNRIDRVLKNPPRLMPAEKMISPTFSRRFGVLEHVFDWAHVLHAQGVDVLASTDLSQEQKDKETEALWQFYQKAPYQVTSLPMNMGYLDSQPYSGAFRQKYPKVNGLFWGYHWLQTAMFDLLYNKTLPQERAVYEVMGKRYRETELYLTDRPFMPMFAENSPVFAAKYPYIANFSDNLHMLHDMVNDILASDWMTEQQKDEQIKRAIWMMSPDAHKNCKPGDYDPNNPLHDHRFMEGMPGMGMMKGATTEVMYMPGLGWMRMDDCHHCSMPLPEGDEAWKASTVSVNGTTMRVRCALCARDYAAETPGEAVLTLATEDKNRPLVLIADEQGNFKTDMSGAVFLEKEASHAGCSEWSQAFTSKAAFDAFVKANPEYKDAKALTLDEWTQREGKEPDTYVKPEGPVDNPYSGEVGIGNRESGEKSQ